MDYEEKQIIAQFSDFLGQANEIFSRRSGDISSGNLQILFHFKLPGTVFNVAQERHHRENSFIIETLYEDQKRFVSNLQTETNIF